MQMLALPRSLPVSIAAGARQRACGVAAPHQLIARRSSNTRIAAGPEQKEKQQQNSQLDANGQVDAEWVQEVAKELVDSPELWQRGEAWFAAQVVSFLLVLFPPGPLRPLLDVSGWLALAGGLAMLVAGQQALGRRLTPLPKPREGSSLVTTGVFQYCRHPMYGGLLLVSAGLCLTLGDDLRLLSAALLFYVLDRKASYEENLLEKEFGKEEYESYRRRTKKLLPYIY